MKNVIIIIIFIKEKGFDPLNGTRFDSGEPNPVQHGLGDHPLPPTSPSKRNWGVSSRWLHYAVLLWIGSLGKGSLLIIVYTSPPHHPLSSLLSMDSTVFSVFRSSCY
ncbi:hypothetical protein Syun_017223 [Stephania yunnanensis]|uniref:Uncharacterized protein n=1 Tax=Stephania yunnanensis TaxID=152371 RepID=A0AAP0P5M6_9MAGN